MDSSAKTWHSWQSDLFPSLLFFCRDEDDEGDLLLEMGVPIFFFCPIEPTFS